MISINEALQAYIDNVSALAPEQIPLQHALHRVLSQDQHSAIDLPRFDQSAMDGYAFCAADTGAVPTELTVAGESTAGHCPVVEFEAGTACRIFTGAPVPAGTDTVIPQERIERVDNRLIFSESYPAGRNIRYQGEEIRTGALLAQRGQRLSPGLIASLANSGLLDVPVTQTARIAVLITGDEVRSPRSLRNRPLGPSEIADSNGTYIHTWLQAHGYSAETLEHIPDTEEAVSKAIAAATDRADLVITTGGASVGDRDFIPSVAQQNGYQQIFWRVAQKPGKPLFFSRRQDNNQQTLLLGLPGNPGAVVVGMELHARSILNCLEAQSEPGPTWLTGKLCSEVHADSRRDRLVRMQITQDNQGQVLLGNLPRQDSHMLSNLAKASVLVHVPSRKDDYSAGDVLNYLVLTM